MHTYLLDGDNVRHGLNRDLGFTDADRVENIRRVAEVAQADGRCRADRAGLVHLAVPRRAAHGARTAAAGEFIEVFVDTPLERCIARDPKGLYKSALAGQIKNFTGIDQPYEAPEAAELVLHTAQSTPEALAERVVDELAARGHIARL